MITYTDEWVIGKHLPFYIFFSNASIADTFLSEYTPQKGFGIYQTPRGYSVYTNTHRYEAAAFRDDGGKGDPIGVLVVKAYPMNQSQTLEAAVKRVQVIGLPTECCSVLHTRHPYEISQNGAQAFFAFVDGQSRVKREKAPVDNTAELAFLQEQREIIEAKARYEETHLFSVRYTAFSDTLQNVQDGVVYRFQIPADAAEQYADKFKENTSVEVSVNDQGAPVIGTLVDEENGWLRIKFHDMERSSFDRIAKTGEIKERVNVEFGFKLGALSLLEKDLSPNAYLLPILVNGKVEPYRITKTYTPYDVREKDGTVHKNVNPSQKEAIDKALNVSDFLLVQGPPGTGKTTIITEMIKAFVKDGLRVLICSKNNLAVDNVLEKCRDLYYDENRTRKMQSLRLGNEEKVLRSVRDLLSRPLTLRIQNDIRKKSEHRREALLEEETRVRERYETAQQETDTLCCAAQFFLAERARYIHLQQQFEKSAWTVLLGRTRKEQFQKEIAFLTEQIDSIVRKLLALLLIDEVTVQPKTVAAYLRLAYNTYDAMERLKQQLMAASVRYGLILGNGLNETLQGIEQANAEKGEILKSLCSLETYSGNPAADRVRLTVPDGEITAAFVDEFRREIREQIQMLAARRAVLKTVLDAWHRELESDQYSLEEPLTKSVKIIGATCIGVNTKKDFKKVEYDVAIVDEAGQITLHDLLVPLVKAKKIILIGDHLQLPPSAETEFCAYAQDNGLLGFDELDGADEIGARRAELERVFSVSLFEQLFRDKRFSANRVMLDTQFRMHPQIAQFISDTFYEGKYKSGVSAEARTLRIAGFRQPMYFIDTCHAKNRYEDENPDPAIHQNSLEAEIVAEHLKNIIVAIDRGEYEMRGKSLTDDDGNYDIGVITAYKKQIELIRKMLRRKLISAEYGPEKVNDVLARMAINTLDSFQGRDNQIILYSFVRSNRANSIGFLKEVRRLNVMMTRAKSLLVMVGDSDTLTHSPARTVHEPNRRAAEYFTALVAYCRRTGGYIDYASEDTAL